MLLVLSGMVVMSSSRTTPFRLIRMSNEELATSPFTAAVPALIAEVCDEWLIGRVSAGDGEALAVLFQRYARLIQSVAVRILGDASEAEDLVQDLFLFIQRKCAIFDSSKSSARSWIVQMAYHRALDRRRYLKTRQFYTQPFSLNDAELVGKPTTESDYSAEAVFGRNGLEKLVSSLSPDQRETLRLHFFDGYTLSALYGRKYTEVAALYGLRMADLRRDMASLHLPHTHLIASPEQPEIETVSLPVEFKPDFQFEKTNLLARTVEKWEAVPVGLLQHLDLRTSMYGYIGLEDFTLYPLIRPGSLVEIDSAQRKISPAPWKTDFDRPIYFTELRDGYVCSWCEIDRGRLMVIPHAHAHREVRIFDYPAEAEIVGRVTGVAMKIVGDRSPETKAPSREK
jgi:RNA polymerase sigma factor (sigma-70 family)